jgi:iron complex transport system ATP-binding protein
MTIKANAVTFRYGPRPVLTEVDLSVDGQGLMALCGPNGAGKSTLLHILAGRLRAQAGRVELDGGPIADLSAAQRARRIAVVPQAMGSAIDLAVEDLVTLGRLHRLGVRDRLLLRPLSPEDEAAVQGALDAMDITAMRQRRLSQLSGGEQARAMIATALAQGADHLLLDEPTAHLDPAFRREILEILARLAGNGRTVLIVLHDLMLAGLYADRVALLEGGRIAAAGDAAEVLTSDTLSRVFRTPLRVERQPESGRPLVLPG